MSLYRRVGEFQEIEEVNMFKEEIINRFGLIPEEFSNYLDVMSLKLFAENVVFLRYFFFQSFIKLHLTQSVENYSERFIKWITDNKGKIV